MASTYPDHLYYAATHEYVGMEGDVATIGITAYALEELGDIVFLELPSVGTVITQGERFGTVESVKAVGELYAPISGTVVATHQAIAEEPETLAADPYENGWLIKVQVAAGQTLEHLMGASEYQVKTSG